MAHRRSWTRWAIGLTAVVALAVMTKSVLAAGQSFLFLQPGFMQELYGVSSSFLGGVAFAPDGDPWVDECGFSGSPLHRYDSQTFSPPVNGTSTLHPESVVPSNAGCGLTNHPNGTLYTNQGGGVVQLDANTGASLAGPFGPAGNALGIATDPQTLNLVYVRNDGTIDFVDPAFTMSGTFSAVTTGNFVDGIAWDPAGNFLFLSNRSPVRQLTILDRTGALVQNVPMPSEPDGIAFHAATPKFVVTNNADGTMTRFDFPGDDFTQVPVQSVFASGGFRGDLSAVGSDGCLYLTQNGTRYDDGTTTNQNSLVRICGGFAPPPGVTVTGRMTGGGRIEGTAVSHGFELHCNLNDLPNNLEVNWGHGNSFHLEAVTSAACTDDPSITPDPPAAQFDTYRGSGTGRYNGAPGATAEWTFTDAGEPGRNDTATIVIKDASSTVVLSATGHLRSGNHQAHP
jgi:hypothetical protein